MNNPLNDIQYRLDQAQIALLEVIEAKKQFMIDWEYVEDLRLQASNNLAFLEQQLNRIIENEKQK